MKKTLAMIMAILMCVMLAACAGDATSDGDTETERNIELAKEICSENGVQFTNVLASETVSETFGFIEAVPTTFILDKSGNVIGDPIVGADVEGYKKAAEEYLAGL